jgi:hypothetical protein
MKTILFNGSGTEISLEVPLKKEYFKDDISEYTQNEALYNDIITNMYYTIKFKNRKIQRSIDTTYTTSENYHMLSLPTDCRNGYIVFDIDLSNIYKDCTVDDPIKDTIIIIETYIAKGAV